MKQREFIRNITIGLTDGITIPFALVAGLSGAIEHSLHIAAAALALAVAGAITMGVGSYMEQAKSPDRNTYITTPFTISLSYLVGGIVAALPYLFLDIPFEALTYSVVLSLSFLFIAGYFESKVNNVNPWIGAVRVMLTGAAAAIAAFYVAKLFI